MQDSLFGKQMRKLRRDAAPFQNAEDSILPRQIKTKNVSADRRKAH